MVNANLLEILRCPVCVKEEKGLLTLTRESWLVCSDCEQEISDCRRYPRNAHYRR